MQNGNWYYAKGGQQLGPVTSDALRDLARNGTLAVTDLVWTDGWGNWAAASTVPDLFPQGANSGMYAVAPTPGYAVPAPSFQPQLGYQTPQYGGAPWAQAPQFAGFWLRFVAALIDGLIVAVPVIIINLILEAVGQSDRTLAMVVSLMGSVFNICIGWLYFAYFESSEKQATFGKQALSLVVTDLNGNRLTFGRATGRFFAKYLSYLTCGVGYILAGVTERKQALHDMVASTLVVRKPRY